MATAAVRRALLAILVFACLLACGSALESRKLLRRGCPCGDVHVVQEGETLQSISEKCNDPFLLVDNPQIEDSDVLFAGVALKVQCSQKGISLCDFAGLLPAKLCQG
eukprot:TRINITY_DN3649_c0_g1_i1.p2 TRINITY_DN3649_c0_g1~~TRINITY_DN3649_c0_g1_i1.p2  ORF type:complete len:107 (+),score=6.32 TRINITY_DN3649_c0_g1_i1:385-705(+)